MGNESLAIYQQAYNSILRGRMEAITNPMQNAAQGSILGNAAQQGWIGNSITSMASGQYGQRTESYMDINRDTRLDVTRADNGYILRVIPRMEGSIVRVLVASTIEELRDLITSEMVSRSMEK